MTDSKPSQPSLVRRFFRRLFSRRILVRIAFVLVCGVTLVALVIAFENWRGARDWERWRTAAEARGEKLDFASLAPKPVAEEENFAATPLLSAVLNYRLDAGTNPIVWLDPAAVQRAKTLSIYHPRSRAEKKSTPELSGWLLGKTVDLQSWADFYADNTNYPAPARSVSAARAVLIALSRYEGELAELRSAAARPHSIFPVRFVDSPAMMLEHLAVLKGLQQFVILHALASGGARLTNEAFAEILLNLRLADALRDEPLLISQLVRMAQHTIALQPVWEGLAQRRYSAAQLEQLQPEMARPDFIAGLVVAMQGERALSNDIFDRARLGNLRAPTSRTEDQAVDPAIGLARLPRMFIYRNQLAINRYLSEEVLPVLKAHPEFIELGKLREVSRQRETRRRTPYRIFLAMLAPAFDRVGEKSVRAQAYCNLAVVACALERHQLAAGAYPDSLATLVPKFIAKLPVDPINGEPLHYRRTEEGRYLIYSVGLNLQDDGGQVVTRKSGDVLPNEGDWVWQYAKP